MIPLLVGAAAVGLGAALLSDDKPKKETVTHSRQHLSENQVKQKLNRNGRSIKTVGEAKANYDYGTAQGSGNTWEAFTKIRNRGGIHARPASMFVQKASSFRSRIQIRAKGKTVDAKSILMIMSMGLTYGDQVTIVAEGYDARRACQRIKRPY